LAELEALGYTGEKTTSDIIESTAVRVFDLEDKANE